MRYFYADDGLCYFDIVAEHRNVVGHASFDSFRRAARKLILECFSSGTTIGGVATGFGWYYCSESSLLLRKMQVVTTSSVL